MGVKDYIGNGICFTPTTQMAQAKVPDQSFSGTKMAPEVT